MEPRTQHSEKFNEVFEYYKSGFWKKKRVRDAVTMKWITQEECDEILAFKEKKDNQ